jgi:hypothetical protein
MEAPHITVCDINSDINTLQSADICAVNGSIEMLGLENATTFVKEIVDSNKFHYIIFTYIPNQGICNRFNARCLYALGNRAVYIVDVRLLVYAQGVVEALAQ